MENFKDIIKKAEDYALSEINLNGIPSIDNFKLSNLKGQKLVKKLKADKDIVIIGTILMDLKLGECIKEGKYQEHIERSANAAKEFLKQFNIDEETFKKIINCIEAHHKTKEFICKEAEICANADCYKFLHPRGFFNALLFYGKTITNLDEYLKQIESRIEEKHNILSLDISKKELEPYYKKFKLLINKAK